MDPTLTLTEGSFDFWFRVDGSVPGQVTLTSRAQEGSDPPGQSVVVVLEDRSVYLRLDGETATESRCSAPGLGTDEWHLLAINFGPPGLESFLDGVPFDEPGSIALRSPGGDLVTQTCSLDTSDGLRSGDDLDSLVGIDNSHSSPGTTEMRSPIRS